MSENGVDWELWGFVPSTYNPKIKYANKKRAIYGKKMQVAYYSEPIAENAFDKRRRLFSKLIFQCYKDDNSEIKMCDEWLDYINFRKWFDENAYKIDGEYAQLTYYDKFNTKILSPETMFFLPLPVRLAMKNKYNKTKQESEDGNILCRGISYSHNKYWITIAAQELVDAKTGKITIGSTDTIEEAMALYKIVKEANMKALAQKYKDKIPRHIYEMLMKWEYENYTEELDID